MIIKKILFLGLFLNGFGSYAQTLGFGYTFGFAFSFGTITNRIGIHNAFFINNDNIQGNLETNLYYNFQSLGKKQKGWEYQLGAGIQLGFGKTDTIPNDFIGLTENNTFRDYAIGFSYNRYWDQLGTTQSTGIINTNILNFNLSSENDLFGNLIHQHDRYRTGSFLIEYQYNRTKIGINALLWTYDYSNCLIIDDESTKKWSRFGYYKDEMPKDKNTSLGVFGLKISQNLPYRQKANLSIGVNGEKFRNGMQNKLIHDQPFFPISLVKRKPPHIPMLTTDGKQYLYQENQTIKPSEFYFHLGLNELPFY